MLAEDLEVAMVQDRGVGQAWPCHTPGSVGAVVSKRFKLFQLSGDHSDILVGTGVGVSLCHEGLFVSGRVTSLRYYMNLLLRQRLGSS